MICIVFPVHAQNKAGGKTIERVEKLVVIDSIPANRTTFFEEYRLADSAGKILAGEDLWFIPGMKEDSTGHISENRDYVLWSYEDEDGNMTLNESILLLNGEWITQKIELDFPEIIDDIGYGFMSQDGQTLYFTAKGEGSFGGKDIFIAQREPITGEFLTPLNLGYPYNSEGDDLMFAIDEENGLGWWATDRNSEEGMVTVYLFLINEVRQNYSEEDDDIEEFALLTNYRATWPEGTEEKIRTILENLPQPSLNEEAAYEFTLPMGKGKIYHNYSDFRNRKTAEVMKEYQSLKEELESQKSELKELREHYSGNKKNLAEKILELEESVETLSLEVESLKSQVYRLEKSQR